MVNDDSKKLLGHVCGVVRAFGVEVAPTEDCIPGIRFLKGERAIYFADFWDKKFGPQPKLDKMYGKKSGIQKRFDKQFSNLPHQDPYPDKGALFEGRCSITTPNNQLFHALSYSGDLDGWCKRVEYAAKELNILLAEIHEDKFVLSDGMVYKLSDCRAEFY